MRLPFFGSKKPQGPVRIPIPETVDVLFLVWFRLQRSAPPEPAALKPVVYAWLDRYAQPPLRDVIKELLAKDLLTLVVQERAAVPELPMELMQYASKGEREEQRLREATHVVVIGGTDICTPLRFGYWGALATGRALARAAGGVLVDVAIPRWLEDSTLEDPVPANGFINVWEHTTIPQSINDRGQLWITTSGLKKFGLPELQITGAPPNLGESLLPVMNGMAHLLLKRLAGAAAGDGTPSALELEPDIRFEESLVEESLGQVPTPPNEGAQGWTMIGLEYQPSQGDMDAFLTLGPPAGFRGSQGEWLNSLLRDLVGTQNTLRHVDHSAETMEAAHLQAMGELPQIRQRFQAGLNPGEQLMVKHGFPTQGEHNEYMWLAVNQWVGDRLSCQLANEPHYRTDLRAGQQFDLTEAQLYDWVLIRADGEHYGGWTNRVVEREGTQ